MQDYKGISFSFSDRHRRRRRRVSVLLLLCLILLVLMGTALWWRSRSSVLRSLEAFHASGPCPSPEQALEGAPFYPASRAELALVARLAARMPAAAHPLKAPGLSLDQRTQLGLSLTRRGDFDTLHTYLTLLPESAVPAFLRALDAAIGLDAKACQSLLPAAETEARGEAASEWLPRLKALCAQIQAGKGIILAQDITQTPILKLDPKRHQPQTLLPGLDLVPLLPPASRRGWTTHTLRIQRPLQEKVNKVFGELGYYGSLVLMDLKDGGLVCAYQRNHPDRSGLSPFEHLFEPGSVIKVLTLALYHSHPGLTHLFPLACEGAIRIGDRTFYDWWKHGEVADPEHALAVSCNIAFARMGLAMGIDRLRKNLQALGFSAAPLQDAPFTFHLGTLNTSGRDDWACAQTAIGLETVRMTTLHGALLAATIALDGRCPQPYLVETRKTPFDTLLDHHKVSWLPWSIPAVAAARTRKAMAAVLTHPEGTGRRIEGDLSMGLKTGTAGDSKLGLDTVLLGFYPLENPTHSFAVFLSRAGKAEWAGARLMNALIPHLPR